MSAPARTRSLADQPIRVMVVDDSAVARGLVGRWIDAEPDLALVASHADGRRALDDLARSRPDAVILDLEMPEMDGLTALPRLLALRPGLVVLVASALSRRQGELSLQALQLGAADYVAKPSGGEGPAAADAFRCALVQRLRALCGRETRPAPAPARLALPRGGIAPRLIAIGSSTGGPQALVALLSRLGPALSDVPVVIAQHMPAPFTAVLAEHLAKASGRPAGEGIDGEPLRAGRLHIAPGGRHMLVERTAAGPVIRLSDAPPEHFCRPAVDPLFRSVAAAYGRGALALVLTGMGCDGAAGVAAIAGAGGTAFAQDEATSVVWGMPGAAAATGRCAAVLSLRALGDTVARLLEGAR